MENKNILLFNANVTHIVRKGEILYSVEGLLKYFSCETDVNFLIQNLKKSYSNLYFHEIKFSSSLKYYVNTIGALKIVMYINTSKSRVYKEWLIKCAIERINEIINPTFLYDRLRTILSKKGIKSNYTFLKAEINRLDNKINYIELDQRILNEDIKNNKVNLKNIDEEKVTVVKLPRSTNSTKNL